MSDNPENLVVTLSRGKPWFDGLFASVASAAQITLVGGDQGDPVSIPAIVLMAAASKEIKSLLLTTCLPCQSPVIVIPSATSSTLRLVRQVLCEGKVDPMTGQEVSRRKLDVEAVLEILAPGVKLVLAMIVSAGVARCKQDEGDITSFWLVRKGTGVTKEELLMSSEEEEGMGVKEEMTMSSEHEDVLELSTASSNSNDQMDMEEPLDEGVDDERYQVLGRRRDNLASYEDETVRVGEVNRDTNGRYSRGGGRAQAGGVTGHGSSSKDGGKGRMVNDGDAIKKLEKVGVNNPEKVNRKKPLRHSRSRHSMEKNHKGDMYKRQCTRCRDRGCSRCLKK
eukprot:GFUD01034645.1.p1 GENE.GFUD01034645.1~~GFUD01034645.1.p1  ORF type:complete len:337 (-),score=96.36 GFUD01034645.1:66-1076(-)